MAIGVSWLIAFPEYLLQVPANRIGHISQAEPFTAAQLKIIQEANTMVLIFAGVLVAMMGRGVMIEPEPGPGAETREAGE